MPKRSKSRVTPWSSRLGVERRPNDPAPYKTLVVTETRSVDYETTLTGSVAAGAVMMLLGQSRRRAQRPIDL